MSTTGCAFGQGKLQPPVPVSPLDLPTKARGLMFASPLPSAACLPIVLALPWWLWFRKFKWMGAFLKPGSISQQHFSESFFLLFFNKKTANSNVGGVASFSSPPNTSKTRHACSLKKPSHTPPWSQSHEAIGFAPAQREGVQPAIKQCFRKGV